ncbi:MAG: transposase [Chloroflexi bacterium]|nr:transposase [Chloroflexota bacterium]
MLPLNHLARFIVDVISPDHDTIANFRKTFLPEIQELFVQILLLAQTAGVFQLGNISMDGSKIHADCSKHQAVSAAGILPNKRLGELENALRQQVRELFALGEQEGQILQRVRLPSEALAVGGSANCLDGTVLFASLLELASLEPMLVLVPGHAFVGWRVWQGSDDYEFVETTMIGSDEFDAAQGFAQQEYTDALERGYFSRGLFDPGGFARMIDVVACHTRGIMPLE